MKTIIFLTLFFISVVVCAQVPPVIVTPEDIELQFIADPTEQWRSVDIILTGGIEYSMEPVGVHNSKGRLGIQTWEFLLQANEPELGKCVVKFNLPSLPDKTFRSYIIRVRVRDDVHIGAFLTSDDVKILGNTGKPSHKGE